MKRKTIYKSLRSSFWDGVFATITTGFTENYLIPYALAMKATTQGIALLSALPNLVSSFFQLKAADITDWLGSRKRIIKIFIFIHTSTLLPVILLPYFMGSDHKIALLILFVVMYRSFWELAVPAWSSMMSDHIPSHRRGAYFGWRNKVFGTINVISAFAAGIVLSMFHKTLAGFTIILTAAMVSRFISWHFLNRMYEPPLRKNMSSAFSFIDFIKRARESNFARFTFFIAAINFAVNMSAPFFAVYMLRDLKFGYLKYTTIVISATIANLATINMWGNHADKVGNMRVIKFVCIFIPIIPALWLFSQNAFYLVAVQLYAGALWAAFNLCASNFIYDSVTPEKRTRCISYYNVINGIAIFCGAISGGFLAVHLPDIFGSKLLCLFLFSGILRGIIGVVFLPKIREVRKVEHVSALEFFYSIVGFRPL